MFNNISIYIFKWSYIIINKAPARASEYEDHEWAWCLQAV